MRSHAPPLAHARRFAARVLGLALAIRPADEGAGLRELLDRMGHTSTRATLIYLHSFDERQRKLADAAGERARAALGKTGIASGAELTRSPGQMP